MPFTLALKLTLTRFLAVLGMTFRYIKMGFLLRLNGSRSRRVAA